MCRFIEFSKFLRLLSIKLICLLLNKGFLCWSRPHSEVRDVIYHKMHKNQWALLHRLSHKEPMRIVYCVYILHILFKNQMWFKPAEQCTITTSLWRTTVFNTYSKIALRTCTWKVMLLSLTVKYECRRHNVTLIKKKHMCSGNFVHIRREQNVLTD